MMMQQNLVVQQINSMHEVTTHNTEMEMNEEQMTAHLQKLYMAMKQQQLEFQWLYRQLEYTNRAIAPTLTAFRFRSIKEEFQSIYEKQDGDRDEQALGVKRPKDGELGRPHPRQLAQQVRAYLHN